MNVARPTFFTQQENSSKLGIGEEKKRTFSTDVFIAIVLTE